MAKHKTKQPVNPWEIWSLDSDGHYSMWSEHRIKEDAKDFLREHGKSLKCPQLRKVVLDVMEYEE